MILKLIAFILASLLVLVCAVEHNRVVTRDALDRLAKAQSKPFDNGSISKAAREWQPK